MAIELHFHGPLLSRSVGDGETSYEAERDDTDEESGGSRIGTVGMLVVLVVLVAVAAAAKKWGEEDEVEVALDE